MIKRQFLKRLPINYPEEQTTLPPPLLLLHHALASLVPLTSPICRFAPSPPPSLKEAKEFAFQGIVKPSKLSKLTKPIVYPSTYDPTSPPPPPSRDQENQSANPKTNLRPSPEVPPSLKVLPSNLVRKRKTSWQVRHKGRRLHFREHETGEGLLEGRDAPEEYQGEGTIGGEETGERIEERRLAQERSS